ncbi:MAG: asparagine synthase (glutamine-hydrolyzing) [Candidatus Moraniibacteriota bacterium]
MCGITGKIHLNTGLVSVEDIEKMNLAIAHRGPDDSGTYISPNQKIGLGHQRLSIIDLSHFGHQPMSYMDRYWIVFNGEIYNFQALKKNLQKEKIYTFKSNTDTEVIMALYHKYGTDCLHHLRGMFSFAIYDDKEKTLFCARDRVGKKPFKYYLDDNVFIFASELKAILTQAEYKKEPDYAAIRHYLTFQYCPAPLTGFKNIKKLEPAHYLLIDLKTNQTKLERYWKLDYSERLDLSVSDWKEKIINKLEESVKLRMIADVPLGAFLSGGIDSSAIVGMMSKFSPTSIKTFSIGFSEKKYDELGYAKIVARKFKTDHTEFIVKPEAMEILPELVRLYEEPFADPSAIPTYYLSKLTRAHVTVAMSGDGGDENFAGYFRYAIQKLSLQLDYLRFFNKLPADIIARIPLENIKSELLSKIFLLLSHLPLDYRKRYASYMYRQNNHIENNLFAENFQKITSRENSLELIVNKFNESGTENKLDQTLYADFSTYLPDDLMTKVDLASMSVALETRSPFLDHEFLELTAKIPSNLKVKKFNQTKWILKETLEDLLPDQIINRSKKGFETPLNIWLKNQLKDYSNELLLSQKSKNRNILNSETVKKILDIHQNTSVDLSHKIWSMIILENWFREYFD